MARGKHSPFTDSVGRYLTKSLFIEMISKDQIAKGMVPLYTLNGDPLYKDVQVMYMESNDPTEYEFATQVFDSWDHFQYMSTLAWFAPHLERWRAELEVKMRSEAIKALMDVAKNAGNRGITAAKFIADAGWKGKKRGRPSTEEVVREKKQQAAIKAELSEDAARVH